MSPIVLRRWGLVMAGISVVSGVSALVLFATGDEGFSSEVLVFCWLLVSFTLTGAALVARRPEEPVGWLVALVGFLASLNVLADEVMEALVTAGVATPWPQIFYWLGGVGFFGWVTVLTCLLPLLFPDGRPPTPRWRWIAWIGVTGFVCLTVAGLPAALKLSPVQLFTGDELQPTNPILAVLNTLGVPLMLFGAVAALVSLVLRFRRSHGIERAQVKWFLLAVAVVAAGIVAEFTAQGSVVAEFLFLGLVLLPVSIAVAVFRYRLYDIDRLIRRTAGYTLVAVVLAGVYLAAVAAVGAVVGSTNSLAVAGATLAAAALFNPVRRRVQLWVDRRFDRTRYDAHSVVEQFSARLRDEVDLDGLTGDLTRLVGETLRPAAVSLVLVGEPA